MDSIETIIDKLITTENKLEAISLSDEFSGKMSDTLKSLAETIQNITHSLEVIHHIDRRVIMVDIGEIADAFSEINLKLLDLTKSGKYDASTTKFLKRIWNAVDDNIRTLRFLNSPEYKKS